MHWSTDPDHSCVSRASAWADARARRVFLRLQRCRTGCARFDAPGGAPALYETQSGAHMFPRVSLCGLLMPVNVPTFLFGACHDSRGTRDRVSGTSRAVRAVSLTLVARGVGPVSCLRSFRPGRPLPLGGSQ